MASRRAPPRAGSTKPVPASRSGLLLAAFLGVVIATAGCAGPAARFDTEATASGFSREVVKGTAFSHSVYRNGRSGDGRRLHVYLDGDGTPWAGGRRPAADPTPREPLVLRLMALDPAPALLLGRPCYNGFHADPPCGPDLWTDRRYSDEIVASMAAALARLAGPDRALVLIGYSGGGTLAVLLAERVSNVSVVVTVAANLDVAAWASLHAYQPLTGSLNPADRPPLPARIRALHLAGALDPEVPPVVVQHVAVRGAGAFRVLDGHDHACCWVDSWPMILSEVEGL